MYVFVAELESFGAGKNCFNPAMVTVIWQC